MVLQLHGLCSQQRRRLREHWRHVPRLQLWSSQPKLAEQCAVWMKHPTNTTPTQYAFTAEPPLTGCSGDVNEQISGKKGLLGGHNGSQYRF